MINKTLYFVLSQENGKTVFATQTEQGWKVPDFFRKVMDHIGLEDPDPYNQWFEQQYGIAVFRRYVIESANIEATVFVLEPKDNNDPNVLTGSWLPYETAANYYDSRSTLHRVLLGLPRDFNKSRVMPWVQQGGFKDYMDWMMGNLHTSGISLTGAVKQIKNAFVSSVFVCPTDKGDLYFKIPGSVFIRELEIMKTLKEWSFLPLPVWMADDEKKSAILMRDMGGIDLPPDANVQLLESVIETLAQFQIHAISHLNAKPELGTYGSVKGEPNFQRERPPLLDCRSNSINPNPFYDWRLSVLYDSIDSLAEEGALLLQDSQYLLEDAEISKLKLSLPYWKDLCRAIQNYSIPDSLDHGDLRPGNIRITKKGIIFFDWAWSAITHPFFSLSSFLHIIHKSLSESEKIHLRDVYLNEWRHFASLDDLIELYQLAEKLSTLYDVVADAHWLRDIQNELAWRRPNIGSPDAWALECRQYYYAKVLRKLII